MSILGVIISAFQLVSTHRIVATAMCVCLIRSTILLAAVSSRVLPLVAKKISATSTVYVDRSFRRASEIVQSRLSRSQRVVHAIRPQLATAIAHAIQSVHQTSKQKVAKQLLPDCGGSLDYSAFLDAVLKQI